MLGAMAFFAVADTFVKLAAQQLPPAHTLLLLVLGTAFVFTLLAKLQGGTLLDRRALHPMLLIRYLCEIVGTFGLVLAFATVPLSTVGAIIQATPLVVTLGAVLVLREKVSPLQWLAIGVGFLGVLLVVQPTSTGFDSAVLWALAAMLGLSGRDLVTRVIPSGLPSAVMAAYTMLAAVPFALLWSSMAEPTLMPQDIPWLATFGMVGCGAVAYLMLIASIRAAPVSVVTPFRYARLIFLLVLGIMVFGEEPNVWVLLGSALIVVAGIAAMRFGRNA